MIMTRVPFCLCNPARALLNVVFIIHDEDRLRDMSGVSCAVRIKRVFLIRL